MGFATYLHKHPRRQASQPMTESNSSTRAGQQQTTTTTTTAKEPSTSTTTTTSAPKRSITAPLTQRAASWNGSQETLTASWSPTNTTAQTSHPYHHHHHLADAKPARARTEYATNVYTQCGRHSKDWLFGGFSVKDTVRKAWEKKRSEKE